MLRARRHNSRSKAKANRYPAARSETRAKLVGCYQTDRGSLWTVRAEQNGMVLDLAGEHVDLVARSATELCAADSDGTWCFTFALDRNGKASSIDMSLTGEPQAQAQRVE